MRLSDGGREVRVRLGASRTFTGQKRRRYLHCTQNDADDDDWYGCLCVASAQWYFCLALNLLGMLCFVQEQQNRLCKDVWKLDRDGCGSFQYLFSEKVSDARFKRVFRMTKGTFERLLLRLSPRLQPSRYARKDHLTPTCILAIVLVRLAHGNTWDMLEYKYGVGRSTAIKAFRVGVDAIIQLLGEQMVRAPETEEEVARLIKIMQHRGFPNACMAVDGSFIPVDLSDPVDYQSYWCFKGFYAVTCMAFVDGNGKFLAIHVGCPGGCSDAAVIDRMELFQRLRAGFLTDMYRLYAKLRYPLGMDYSVSPQVLGDAAFTLYPWFQAPFEGTSIHGPERTYNYTMSSARMIVEHAFGRLKGRFRMLLTAHRTSRSMATKSIYASVILHNFLLEENDAYRQQWSEGVPELEEEPRAIHLLHDDERDALLQPQGGATVVRDKFAEYFTSGMYEPRRRHGGR